MKRIAVLAAITGALLLVFGVSDRGALEPPHTAHAATTTWMYPSGSVGLRVPAPPEGDALELTDTVPSACPTGCYITRIEPDIVYMGDPDHVNGTTANFNNNNTTDGVWNHHFVIIDTCDVTKRVISAGNERTVLQVPAGYAYRAAPGCGWLVNLHFHNDGIKERFVAIKLDITYQTTPLPTGTPVWLDIGTTTNASEFTVGTGLTDTHTGSGAPGISPNWTSGIQGKIIGMGGHVHDYGFGVSAFNFGAGDRPDDFICTSKAGYGSGSVYLPSGGSGMPGHPTAAMGQTLNPAYQEQGPPANAYHIQYMDPCSITERMSVICVNDVIQLHAQYNNTSGFPIPDAMGIMVMYVATTNLPNADGDGVWDGCDTSDSDIDGYSDRAEVAGGTQANDPCADDALDPAWPADQDNDRDSDISDISALAGSFNKAAPPAPVRHDIAPDPVNALVDITDVSSLAGRFNDTCT